MDKFKDIIEYIASELNTLQIVSNTHSAVIIAPPDDLINTLLFLRNDTRCRCESLLDIFATDYPNKPEPIEITYILISIVFNFRIYLKINLSYTFSIPSATNVFKSANWLEREVYDMYGVKFTGHENLQRILTDYGFEGHPMLKRFPLSGYTQVRYNVETSRVEYEPVDLQQEYRSFDYTSPWEEMQSIAKQVNEKNNKK